eukprot:1079210-Rhodomonas_salina.3
MCACTALFTFVLETVGYVSRSESEEAEADHTITGVASIDAASANGPVTAERYDPTTTCLPSSCQVTTCPTATEGTASVSLISTTSLKLGGSKF